MAGRLASLIDRGAQLLEGADPECAPSTPDVPGAFLVGGLPVQGVFASGDVSISLDLTGGGQEKLGGTLVISRLRYPAKPALMSILTAPDGTRYRVAMLGSDNASWTLTLTHPNDRHLRG